VALIAQFLIDTSAVARMRHPVVRGRLEPLIIGGVVAEAFYSARSPREYQRLWADRHEAYEYLPTDDEHWQRAFTAQRPVPAGTARLVSPIYSPPCWPASIG
jgi:hypothetical protein